jgi:hypothetical protein
MTLPDEESDLPPEQFALFPRNTRGMIGVALALSLLGLGLATWAWLGGDLARGAKHLSLDGLLLTRRLRGLIEIAAVVPVLILAALVLVRRISPAWLVPAIAVGVLITARLLPGNAATAALVAPLDRPGLNDEGTAGDTPVVALVVGKRAVAVPLSLLARCPLLVLEEFDQRVALLANVSAGRVLVCSLDPAVKAADLEALGTLDGSLLVYNRRYGQLIVGMSGRCPDGSRPIGFGPPRPPRWTTAGAWRLASRDAIVLKSPAPEMPPTPADALAVFFDDKTPLAVPPSILPKRPLEPMNTELGERPAVIVRDEQGRLLAFDRALDKQIIVRLQPTKNAKGRGELLDVVTGSRFTIDGVALDDPVKGSRLSRLPVEPGVSWSVLKRWCPETKRVDLP